MNITNNQLEKSRLGRLLVGRGLITEFQLELALDVQRSTGQKLGEVLKTQGLISDRDIQRALRHQNRYRNVAAFATMLVAPLQPVIAFAAAPAAAMTPTAAVQQARGLQALTEEEMGSVSAKGLEQLFAQIEVLEEGAEGSREVTAVDGLKVATKAFVPIYNMLDADVSIEGVQYAEGKAAVTVRADGKLELAMPERIAHISMNNIRVAGTTTGSFGDISLRDIQFHPDSRMVIYGR